MSGRVGPRGGHRSPARGYVLVMVMAALAMMALVAGRFAARIDDLRRQTSTLHTRAQASLASGNALSATLYAISTRPTGPAGFGPALQPELRADDRAYRLTDGAEVRLQDMRGLYPLNAPERPSFARLMAALGIAANDADTYLDVLLDYTDTDDLRRLNGAEGRDYGSLGLPPPRNDWLRSTRELATMPHWRDNPALLNAVQQWGSTGRTAIFNPNTARLALLPVIVGDARPEQLQLFDTLRRDTPFLSGLAAQRATGLRLDRDDFIFSVGDQFRVTVSVPGLPQAIQYNVLLLPGGRDAPWLISEVHSEARPESRDPTDRATEFPLVLTAR